MTWRTYVALGDSLSAGKGDPDADGRTVGWAARMADVLTARTGEPCELTNLAADGATVTRVLHDQLPAIPASPPPDLVSLTVGMNDVRAPDFDQLTFASELKQLFEGLATSRATLLTCTLPDIADMLPLPGELIPLARDRMRDVSGIIRRQAAACGAFCLDAWILPEVADPSLYSADRLHPNARGHQLIAAAFADLLTRRDDS